MESPATEINTGRIPGILGESTLPDPILSDRLTLGLADYFHLLFDRITLSWGNKTPQRPVIGFTSCRKGEGVSTVCRHLLIAAAQKLQRPVLLINTDRDSPKAESTSSKETRGFYDVLAGISEPGDVLRAGPTRWAFLMHPGSPESRKQAVVRSELLVRLFEFLKREFFTIIVDLPPCYDSGDCFAIANTVDGVVLVVEAERVRSPIIARARDQLFQAGAHVIGVVLNKRRKHVPEWLYRRL